MFIAFVSWAVLGLIVGFIASKVVNLRGDEPLIGILIALVGAVAGGVIFATGSGRGIVAWDLWSWAAAAGGAVVAVVIYHAIRSRSISHEQQSVRRSY